MQSEVRQPIEGLPVLNGFKCKECRPHQRPRPFYTTSEATFVNHARGVHQKRGNKKILIETWAERVPLQALGAANPRRTLFQVGHSLHHAQKGQGDLSRSH